MGDKDKVIKPLLKIIVNDINTVPEIEYKGKQIESIRNVDYSWETSSSSDYGSHAIIIDFIKNHDNAFHETITITRKREP